MQQAEVYVWRRQAGKSVAVDVATEEFQENPAAYITKVARAIGICNAAATNTGLVSFLHSMGKQLHSQPSENQATTMMHDVHSEAERTETCGAVATEMASHAACRSWNEAGGLASANVLLKHFMACTEHTKGEQTLEIWKTRII